MKKMTYTGTKKRDNKKTTCWNYVVTTSCFCFSNTQLTKPARVNGPFVIVMERLPTALPKQSGTKRGLRAMGGKGQRPACKLQKNVRKQPTQERPRAVPKQPQKRVSKTCEWNINSIQFCEH